MGTLTSKHKINNTKKKNLRKELDNYKQQTEQLIKDNIMLVVLLKQYDHDAIFKKYIELSELNRIDFETGNNFGSKNKENICCICKIDIMKRIALVPCGHTSYCDMCAHKIKKCSLCKQYIYDIINIY